MRNERGEEAIKERQKTERSRTTTKKMKKEEGEEAERGMPRISKIDDKGIMTNFKSSRKSTRISTKRGYVTKFHKGT